MERVELYCQERPRGEITLDPRGSRTRVRASMDDPGDGLYRAALLGERGELLLGVLEPTEGRLVLRRELYSRDIARLGPLRRGEARRSFRFGEEAWRETEEPDRLFRSPFLRSRLTACRRAWWRREGDRLILALPLEAGKPFPLEILFCLARVREVEGMTCAVYAFDGGEEPLPP